MRITSGMYYNNLYENNNKMSNQLFDVNKQIASGLKIQYANEDPESFMKTMKLDDEITTLTQVKKSSESAIKFSSQTDTTIGELTKSLDSFKVKIVQASNAGHSQTSLNAIAQEMKGLRDHMMSLANTSIDGQFLFSGTATDTKPINSDGTYNGNDGDMKTFFGNSVQQTYNVTGKDLFFGDESSVAKKVTTNISLYNQTQLYPDVMQDENIPRNASKEEYITTKSTIRDLMGDSDNVVDATNAKHHFYINGVNHSGDSFKKTISMKDTDSVETLLSNIGQAYGNSDAGDVVDVSLNETGQIVVKDRLSGSSKLQFNFVGNTNDVVDATTDANGATLDLDALHSGKTNVKEFIKSNFSQPLESVSLQQNRYDPNIFELKSSFVTKDGQLPNSNTLLSNILSSDVKSLKLDGTKTDGSAVGGGAVAFSAFDITSQTTMGDLMNALKSAYSSTNDDLKVYLNNGQLSFDSATSNLDIVLTANDGFSAGGQNVNGLRGLASAVFDQATFLKKGETLNSNVSQIIKSTNAYATDSTKLVDVSTKSTLVGESLAFDGIDINGARFNSNFNFTDPNGVTFDVLDNVTGSTTSHIIYNADGTQTKPDDLTYKQFSTYINMGLTGSLPAPAGTNTHPDGTPYTQEDEDAYALEISKSKGETYLDSEGKLTFTEKGVVSTKAEMLLYDVHATDLSDTNGSILSFQSNNALSVSDPKNNFFKALDHIIKSVEDGKFDADGLSDDPRNIGMQNSIQLIDDVADHISRQQTQAGVHTQVLESQRNRSELLIVNTQMLRSDVIDTDIAEASLKLNQLSLNYQALLSTVSKVTKLSLVNYL